MRLRDGLTLGKVGDHHAGHSRADALGDQAEAVDDLLSLLLKFNPLFNIVTL